MFGFQRVVEVLVLSLVVGTSTLGCAPEEGPFPCDCEAAESVPPEGALAPGLGDAVDPGTPADPQPAGPSLDEEGGGPTPGDTPEPADDGVTPAPPASGEAPEAAGDDSTPSAGEGATELEVLVAPIRVHVLQSDTVPALDASLTDAEIHDRFGVVNEIWAAAGVRFEVESIQRISAQNEVAFGALIDSGSRRAGPALSEIYDADGLLADGWNAVLIEDFGQMPPGVYSCNTGVLVAARFFGPNHREAPANVLAHELGHALSLPHLCGEGENLMCADGMSPRALFEDQIEAARSQVRQGAPARCGR